jgi:hypothetical protein
MESTGPTIPLPRVCGPNATGVHSRGPEVFRLHGGFLGSGFPAGCIGAASGNLSGREGWLRVTRITSGKDTHLITLLNPHMKMATLRTNPAKQMNRRILQSKRMRVASIMRLAE